MIDAPSPSGYDAKHFEQLIEVEDRHFWFVSRNRTLSTVLAHVTVADNARVLEIGTGTGNTLRVLERAFPARRSLASICSKRVWRPRGLGRGRILSAQISNGCRFRANSR